MKIKDILDKYLKFINKLDDLEPQKKKVFLGISAIVVLIIVYIDFSYLIKSQLKGIKTVTPKIIKLKKDIDTFNKDLVAMQDTEAKLKQSKQKFSLTVKKFISEEEITALLQDIAHIADKYQVKIIKIIPLRDAKAKEEIIAEGKFLPVIISLDLSCGYHAFGSFMNDLENATQFIAVQEIRISPDSADYFKRNVNLVLKTYVKK
jgi:Tfp pilus assembly protein PilO